MAVFPHFNNRVVTQYPYEEDTARFFTTQSYIEAGFTYTQSLNPTTPHSRFVARFDMFTKPEMRTLENFWNLMGASAGIFTFTDDANVAHTQCYFEEDSLEFQYLEPGHYAASCAILALN